MNNEELKKKISQIISEYCCPYGKTHKQLYGDDRMCYSKMNFAECNPITECTDALIAAGIGDVTEWKEKAEKHRVQVLPDGTIKQLYSDEEVEDIARQRDEYKHRAEVAELVVKNLNDIFTFDYQTVFEQAEKELAEENGGKKKV